MENTVECILIHGDGMPEELIRTLTSSTAAAGGAAAGAAGGAAGGVDNVAGGGAVNNIDADGELARQLAAQDRPSTNNTSNTTYGNNNIYTRTTTNNAAATAGRNQQLQEQRRPMASTVTAPKSPSRSQPQQQLQYQAAAVTAHLQQLRRTSFDNKKSTVVHDCDDKGRCIHHPHIQLRKKAIMGVLGGWKVIQPFCLDCERLKFMENLMAKEASEKQLNVESSTVTDDDGLKVSGDVSSRTVTSSEGTRRQQQPESRSKKQLKQPSSQKKVKAQRRSRRQSTLSPKEDRNDVIRELSRQSTISPEKDRKSVRGLRRQSTLSPEKDRNGNRERRRQRTLSPNKDRDGNSSRRLRRQSTLSPEKDRNGNRERRRQRTLSPNKDRDGNRSRRLRRQSTLSPEKDRNGNRERRRQRTLSPNKDRDGNRSRRLRRQRTLSPKSKQDRTKLLRRQRTFPSKKALKSPSSSSTKRDESDSSDNDSSSSSSSSFQRHQQLKRWAMWKRMAEKMEMESIDAKNNENDKRATRPSNDGTGGKRSNKTGRTTSARADDKVKKMESIDANDDNENSACPSNDDTVGDSSMNTRNTSSTTTSKSIRHNHQMCPLHPTVRMRNNKCSRCCALEKTLEIRKAKKKDAGCGMAVAKSDADGASSGGDGNDSADSAREDDVSLREEYSSVREDEDNDNGDSGDSEKFSNDDSSGFKQWMDDVNEENSTADSAPVSLFDDGSFADLTNSKLPISDVDECCGDFGQSKATIKMSNRVFEDVYSDSDEDDDGPSTVVEQGSQSQSEASVITMFNEGRGNDDRLESDDATGSLSVSTSERREIENGKSAAMKGSAQDQTSAVEDHSTPSVSSETVTRMSDRSEAETFDTTLASHENSNDARPEESNEMSASSAASEANTSNKVQHQFSEIYGLERKSHSSQRLSRSTVRRDAKNKRRPHSKFATDAESSIPFFAALVENARSRSQSVTRNPGGQGRKNLWARAPSRGRSARQNDGSAHTSRKEETLASNTSSSRSFSLTRSFTKKGGKDTDNKASNMSTNGEKNTDGKSRGRKEKGRKNGSLETESALKKTMISSPEKATEFLHLRANHREPITHPNYKLGDLARDEDMIMFPTKSRSRSIQDSNQSTSSADEEQDRINERKFIASVKELHHLDAAFIRRSNGRWTYAIVANIDDKGIVFVVDKTGSTKILPNNTRKWKDTVRRIKVLAHVKVSCSSSK